jgi:hypothetical protein
MIQVDCADIDLLCLHWKIGRDGYAYRAVGRRKLLLHREITGAARGCDVHHVNGCKSDNRRCNLEVLTPSAHGRKRKGIGHAASGPQTAVSLKEENRLRRERLKKFEQQRRGLKAFGADA